MYFNIFKDKYVDIAGGDLLIGNILIFPIIKFII